MGSRQSFNQGIPGSGVGPGGAKAPAYDSDPAPGGASPRLNFFGPAPGGAFAPAKDSGPAPGGAFAPAQNSDPAPGGAFAPAEDSGPAPGGVKAPATPDLSQVFMKIFTFLNIPPHRKTLDSFFLPNRQRPHNGKEQNQYSARTLGRLLQISVQI